MEKVLTPSVGTKLKLNVHADVGSGLHMSDVEFECMFYTNNASRRSLTVKKRGRCRRLPNEILRLCSRQRLRGRLQA